MDTRIQELIKVRSLMNQLKAKEKDLKQQLIDDAEFTGYKGDDCTISKAVRRDVVLKEGVDKAVVMGLFPDTVKQSLDMQALREKQEAHDLLEIKEIPILTVKLK